MKAKWLNRNLIVMPIWYCLCLTEKQYFGAMKHCGVTDSEPSLWAEQRTGARACFAIDKAKKRVCFVCLNESGDEEPLQVAALLMHEAVHIWQRYSRDLGSHYDVHSDEFEAYSIQQIAQQLMYAYIDMKGL